jgi:ATP-dependent Clp protease ATP-binding subunit ClpB
LWQLLLGILDKATLTLGDNRRVDFSRTIVVMTSNLGAREMSELISGGIGFAPTQSAKVSTETEIDQKIYRTAVEAARHKFSPEFMNRIDKIVVFRSLKEQHLRQILGLELQALQERIMRSADIKFTFECSEAAKELLLKEGVEPRYGARHLKRAIERFLVYPLSNLVASEQIEWSDHVYVDSTATTGKLFFTKRTCDTLVSDVPEQMAEPEHIDANPIGVFMIPQTKVARTRWVRS